MYRNLHGIKAGTGRVGGFTLIELIVVIVILGVLSAVALPKFVDLGSSARTASIQALAGSVKTGIGVVKSLTALHGAGTAAGPVNLTFVTLDDSTQVRVWSGYPDRWCDGIGAVLQGAKVPTNGCYLSSAAVTGDDTRSMASATTSCPTATPGGASRARRRP